MEPYIIIYLSNSDINIFFNVTYTSYRKKILVQVLILQKDYN